MEYRKMEKLGVSPSLLGFGCMRFPMKDGKIDEKVAEAMLDRAIQEGVNYIDTAYPYHDGDSEPFVGRALKKYNRDRFFLATKLPVWKVGSVEDAETIFHEQLERLQVDYVDFYLLHALDKNRFAALVEQGIIPWAEELKKQGKIKYLGFSFHDDYDTFEKILTYRDWDFCQIQYNYMDIEVQAGEKGYKLAERLGIPMVIMEPVKGGTLSSLPEDIERILKEKAEDKSIASWALRFVGSHPNVKVILSGMSTLQQVEDNLSTFSKFEPLSEEEFDCIAKVARTIKGRMKNGCTACRYCMPCPFGLDIPRNFAIWNTYAMYGNRVQAEKAYFTGLEEKKRADQCKKCGECEKECPQSIPIREHLSQMAEEFKQQTSGHCIS